MSDGGQDIKDSRDTAEYGAILKTAITLRTASQYHSRSLYYPTNKSIIKHTQIPLNTLLIPHTPPPPTNINRHPRIHRANFFQTESNLAKDATGVGKQAHSLTYIMSIAVGL